MQALLQRWGPRIAQCICGTTEERDPEPEIPPPSPTPNRTSTSSPPVRSADAQPMEDVDAAIDRTTAAPPAPAGQVGPTSEAPEARSFMKPPVQPEARTEDYDLVAADTRTTDRGTTDAEETRAPTPAPMMMKGKGKNAAPVVPLAAGKGKGKKVAPPPPISGKGQKGRGKSALACDARVCDTKALFWSVLPPSGAMWSDVRAVVEEVQESAEVQRLFEISSSRKTATCVPEALAAEQGRWELSHDDAMKVGFAAKQLPDVEVVGKALHDLDDAALSADHYALLGGIAETVDKVAREAAAELAAGREVRRDDRATAWCLRVTEMAKNFRARAEFLRVSSSAEERVGALQMDANRVAEVARRLGDSTVLPRVLAAVLVGGNALNAGNRTRGAASAFGVEVLATLAGTTVCEGRGGGVVRNLADWVVKKVGVSSVQRWLSEELMGEKFEDGVKKAGREDAAELRARAAEIREEANTSLAAMASAGLGETAQVLRFRKLATAAENRVCGAIDAAEAAVVSTRRMLEGESRAEARKIGFKAWFGTWAAFFSAAGGSCRHLQKLEQELHTKKELEKFDVDAASDRTTAAPPAPAGQVGPTSEAPEVRSFMKPPVQPEARTQDYDLVVADTRTTDRGTTDAEETRAPTPVPMMMKCQAPPVPTTALLPSLQRRTQERQLLRTRLRGGRSGSSATPLALAGPSAPLEEKLVRAAHLHGPAAKATYRSQKQAASSFLI